MPNQMIALQARNPQLPDPAQRTARLANMMNMVRQQEAAQRQTMQAQQAMDIEAAKEARAAALHGPALTKAQQDNILQALEIFREGVADIAEGDITAAEAVRADLVARVPGWGKVLPPASSWDRNTRYGLMMKADKEIDKTISTPVASLEVSVDGTPTSVTVGGLRPGQQPVYDVVEPKPMPASRATPTTPPVTAGTDVDMRATRGVNTTPRDLIEQGMNPNNIPSGMPTSRPVSFNQSDMGGAGAVQMTPDVMSRIVDSAFQTGVMAQVDFDQLLASQPQQNKQALVDSFRRANITLQADAPSLADSGMGQQQYDGQTPQSIYAKLPAQQMPISNADLGSQPMMRQTQAQTQPRTITKLQQKTPNVAPYPGSAQVPLSRVAAEAKVARESPAEAAAKERAVAEVKANIEAEKKAAEKLPGRKQVSTIIKKIRSAYEQLEKREAIASEKRGGFANVMDYFATSSLGREAQKALGTSASKYLSEIVNSRKLLATAIKNATGMSAQEMNSNVELQLTLDALTDPTQGIEAARTTLDTLEELYGVPAPRTATAAPRAATKTPVIPEAAKQMLRKDPSPRQRAFFDRAFGKGAAAKVLGNR